MNKLLPFIALAAPYMQPTYSYITKAERERIKAKSRRVDGILTDADREAIRKAEEKRQRKAARQ